ncbi:MAG: SDR family oxidoreductase [Sandaracinaceae bacterium]|nr:SDR family oxidoreductase [Sandaracinaceae bacterium]
MSDTPRRPAARAPRKPGETTSSGSLAAPRVEPTIVPSASGELRAFFETSVGGPAADLESLAQTIGAEVGVAATGELPSATSAGRASVAPSRHSSAGDSLTPRIPNDWDGAVLVTGICGRLGRLVARLLHREDRVVGIDRRPFVGKPKDIVHHQFDLRRKKTRDVFRAGGIRAVVHLGIMHDLRASTKEHHTWNVVGFQKVLEYMTQYGVPKLVVLSSANVYGPSPENPQFLTEDAPLLGAQQFSEIRDLVEVDHLAQSFFWKNPQVETVILRPCHILGSVRNAPSNYLRLERPIKAMGFDPMVQVIHERDVAEAVRLSLRRGVRGIFNLRGPGELPLSHIFRILGRRPLSMPAGLLEAGLKRLFRYRMTSFPSPEIDHIRYVCMVDDTRARKELGFAPRYDIEDTVRAVTEIA